MSSQDWYKKPETLYAVMDQQPDGTVTHLRFMLTEKNARASQYGNRVAKVSLSYEDLGPK
jgi:hypothetical protein